MNPDEINEVSESAASEPAETPVTPGVEGALNAHIGRRTFLAAAALGAAAAGFFSKTGEGLSSLGLGPVTAFADNLSGLNCTANDVRIIGPGIIVNEACDCNGTFTARVKFRINNNTGTTRYCVKVHFCPGALPGGGTFAPGDILIGDIPSGEADYFVDIPNYPCGAGNVCFGAAGPDPDGGFPKGAACPAGQCCTTITWDVNPGCPTKQIGSKCRHQQVCIQGRGATITCADTSCAPTCGGTSHLKVCATGGNATKTFTLGGTSQTTTGCATFTVTTTATTTYSAIVNFGDGCTKTVSTVISVTPATASISASAPTSCTAASSSNLTFTATPSTGTFTWLVDSTTQTVTGSTFTYTANPDGVTHTVGCSMVTTSGCAATASNKLVYQCVTSTIT